MKYIPPFLLSICSVFAPIEKVIFTVAVLIAVDLITGILAAKKRGEPITSAGLRRTISKLVVYEAALLIGFLAETNLLGGAVPVVKMVSSMVGLVELKSCYENLQVLGGQPLLQSVLDKLGSNNQ